MAQKGDTKTPSLSSLSDKIYAAMADITSDFHVELSRRDEALSGDEGAAPVPTSNAVSHVGNKRASLW